MIVLDALKGTIITDEQRRAAQSARVDREAERLRAETTSPEEKPAP